MESVSLDTLTFDHPAASRPARFGAMLSLPMQAASPSSCMVILTSSAGVQRHQRGTALQRARLHVTRSSGRGRQGHAAFLQHVALYRQISQVHVLDP